MKRGRVLLVVTSVAVGLVSGGLARPAFAIKQFQDEFKAMYVKADSSDPAEKALAMAVVAAKCNVCHKGKEKKERNAYGEALADLLDKKEDAKNMEKTKEKGDLLKKQIEELTQMADNVISFENYVPPAKEASVYYLTKMCDNPECNKVKTATHTSDEC
jgi:hypothetical protein